MKRLILPILLLCLLLCGCGEKLPQDHSHDATLPPQTPTEPGGSYDPSSRMEALTDGAVRAYPMDAADTYAVAAMGDDLLIFSGKETTTLTRLSGENLFVTASAQLDHRISPESGTVSITEKGIVYYSPESRELVVLDPVLTQTRRIGVPEDAVGEPVLTADRKFLYYCTADSLRCLELENGISRLLKELSYPAQSVKSVLLQDTVVCCVVLDDAGETQQLYFSTENGQTLYAGSVLPLTTWEDRYFAAVPGGVMQSLVYGTAGEEPYMLTPARTDADGWYLEKQNLLITADTDTAETVVLERYDLSSGKRTAEVTLQSCGGVLAACHRGTGEQVYVLCTNASDNGVTLYRWDTAATPTDDETVYSGSYFTRKNPDTQGLARCQSLAQEIGSRHGVRILIGEDAVAAQPWDYELSMEYQVPVLERELETLDQLLANYPEGFLKATAEGTDRGDITICLVRAITGTPESSRTDTVANLQFRHDGSIYVALTVGTDLEGNLYHAIYFAVETRLLSSSNDCYQWEKLNPGKFQYDYDPAANAQRSATEYLEGDGRYFIDVASMNSPSEDRARILQYAMMPGNEVYFQSEYMQEKLLTLCTGIREAYGLKKSPENFLWEQYLNGSLAYTN